jgi:hypothetical protein
MLVSLDAFHRAGRLYDEVYTSYGPFYFESMDALFRLGGLSITHDHGRLVWLGTWVLVSLFCGWTSFVISRSSIVGCCVQLLVFKCLMRHMPFEPMHPGGLLCLLLACLAATVTLGPGRPRLAAALQGALVAFISLVKINVGAFALLAVALQWVAAVPALAGRRIVRRAAVVVVALAPVALMGTHLGLGWVRGYVLVATTAILGVALASARVPADARLGAAHVGWVAAAGVAATAAVLGFVFARGTSLAGAIEGIVVAPLRHPTVFMVPVTLRSGHEAVALASVAACALVLLRRGSLPDVGSRASLAAAISRLAVGLVLSISVSSSWGDRPFAFFFAPLLWVAALPPAAIDHPPVLAWSRRLLPALAALQILHAYPVSGSQFYWSSFLLVPAGSICVVDGLRQVDAWASVRLGALVAAKRWIAAAAGLAVVLAIGTPFLSALRADRARYKQGTPLPLPGSTRLRLPSDQVETVTSLMRDVRDNCTALVTIPGLNSFYLWSGLRPPTGFNVTSWMYLLEPRIQARIVEKVVAADRPCVVELPWLAQMWAQWRPLPDAPLVRYVSHGFSLHSHHGDYTLLVRSPGASR